MISKSNQAEFQFDKKTLKEYFGIAIQNDTKMGAETNGRVENANKIEYVG